MRPEPMVRYAHNVADCWELCEELIDTTRGVTLVLAKGFVCDGASSPRPTWALGFSPPEIGFGPAFHHDDGYRHGGWMLVRTPAGDVRQHFTKDEVDLFFLDLMAQYGVPEVKRIAAYEAVRELGASSWQGDTGNSSPTSSPTTPGGVMSDNRDTRIIVGVTKPFATSVDPAKQGEIHVQTADGADLESAGIVERNEDGVVVQRVEIRTADGLTDGPLYTPFVHFMMTQLGATVPDVGAVSAPVVLAPAPQAPAAPIPSTVAVTIPAVAANATPAEHASRAHAALSVLWGVLTGAAHGAGAIVDAGAGAVVAHPELVAAVAPKYGAAISIVAALEQMLHAATAAPAATTAPAS